MDPQPGIAGIFDAEGKCEHILSDKLEDQEALDNRRLSHEILRCTRPSRPFSATGWAVAAFQP
jgi:hypothetical protein